MANNDTDNGLTDTEKQQIQKDIDAVKASLVSDKTAELIAQERAKARTEAEKEFQNNARIKELEEKLKQTETLKTEIEKKSAEELDKIKKKVDELTGSRMPVAVQNPFNQTQTTSLVNTGINGQKKTDEMTEEEYGQLEQASYEVFMNRRTSQNNKDY